MWARVVEFMLACWLSISPFIFRHPFEETFLWANDLTCAVLIALFALLSFVKGLEKIHLLTLGVALWLWGLGYTTFPDPAPIALENDLTVGLLLLMIALVPSQSSLPPRSWRKFYNKKEQ